MTVYSSHTLDDLRGDLLDHPRDDSASTFSTPNLLSTLTGGLRTPSLERDNFTATTSKHTASSSGLIALANPASIQQLGTLLMQGGQFGLSCLRSGETSVSVGAGSSHCVSNTCGGFTSHSAMRLFAQYNELRIRIESLRC